MRDAEERRRIVRSQPVELEAEAGPIRPRRVRPMADHQRADPLLPLAADVQERLTLRRAQPLVTVAREVCRTDRAYGQREHARSMSAAADRIDSAPVPPA